MSHIFIDFLGLTALFQISTAGNSLTTLNEKYKNSIGGMPLPGKFDYLKDDTFPRGLLIDENGVVHEPTGVVYEITQFDREKRRERLLKRAEKDKWRGHAPSPLAENFIWYIYSIFDRNFSDLTDAQASYLMFLSTYSSFNGSLVADNNVKITWGNIHRILNISERSCYRIRAALLRGEYISEEKDGSLRLSEQLFRRGRLDDKLTAQLCEQDKYIIRMYFAPIRSLYDSAGTKSKGQLSYLFKVIPFLNREFNIICHNPQEQDVSKITPMTLGEFCDSIGYGRTNSSRMAHLLFDPIFEVDGKKHHAICYVANKSLSRADFCMYVNPKVFYRGTHENYVKILSAFQNDEITAEVSYGEEDGGILQ